MVNQEKLYDPLFDISNRLFIVTGGLGQLGVQFVKTLVNRGAFVSVWSRNIESSRIEKAFDSFKIENVRFYSTDITNKKMVEDTLDAMKHDWGKEPDGIINNAGLDTQPSAPPEVSGPFEEFPEEVFREVVNVNLIGTFLCCQAVGKRMVRANKAGVMINIGSIYGMLSPVQDIYTYKKELTGKEFIKPVAYSAAKSGIYNLTRYLATYWGKKNIRINTLTPSGVWRDTQDMQFQERYCARMPIGRMANEDEFNGAIVFLLSDASKYMTGANLVIDGGWTAW